MSRLSFSSLLRELSCCSTRHHRGHDCLQRAFVQQGSFDTDIVDITLSLHASDESLRLCRRVDTSLLHVSPPSCHLTSLSSCHLDSPRSSFERSVNTRGSAHILWKLVRRACAVPHEALAPRAAGTSLTLVSMRLLGPAFKSSSLALCASAHAELLRSMRNPKRRLRNKKRGLRSATEMATDSLQKMGKMLRSQLIWCYRQGPRSGLESQATFGNPESTFPIHKHMSRKCTSTTAVAQHGCADPGECRGWSG